MGRSRKGVVAAAVAAFGLVTVPTAAQATEDVTTARYGGASRYATAAVIAGQPELAGATTAILATGEAFPDALAASGLAGSVDPAPIVLTESHALSDAARDALEALDDLSDVIVVGGTAAVSDAVIDAVEAMGHDVARIAGDDRYETAAAIAGRIGAGAIGRIDDRRAAFVATGEGFADALAGGPLAYAASIPILLVGSVDVPDATADALADLDVEQVVILGGTGVVTPTVADELADITGNPVVRVAGGDRFATAAAVAELAVAELGWAPARVLLASGRSFPDALAGGPLGGERSAPILLTGSLPDTTVQFLDRHSDTITTVACLGGTGACSDADLDGAEAAAEGTGDDPVAPGDTATSDLEAPELQRVRLETTDVDELAVVYEFEFDEELDDDTEIDPDDFKLYGPDTRNPAGGGTFAAGAELELDGDTVTVTFNLADYGVADATLGAVEPDAVVDDDDGNGNPGQSLAVRSDVAQHDEGLVAVEITDDEEGIVEFTFERAQTPGLTEAWEYQLVERDGTVHVANELDGEGTSETSPDDDEPSRVVEVDFETDLSDAVVRRGVVITNPELGVPAADVRVHSADVSAGGDTDLPDLVDVELPAENDELDEDEVLFVFDEDLDGIADAPASYALVYSHCDPGAAASINDAIADVGVGDALAGAGYDDDIRSPATCAVRGTDVELDPDIDDRGVVVTFGSEHIDHELLVAATVEEAAEVADDDAETNEAGEVELGTGVDDGVYDDGAVLAPQLLSVTAETDTTSSGDFEAYVLTFTFDSELDDDLAITDGFRYVFDDDDQSVEGLLTECDHEDEDTVVCEIDDEDSTVTEATVAVVEAGAVRSVEQRALDADELAVRLPNPEASVEMDAPEEP